MSISNKVGESGSNIAYNSPILEEVNYETKLEIVEEPEIYEISTSDEQEFIGKMEAIKTLKNK